MSQKYVVVHFFDSPPVGYTFPASAWLPHVTLLPVFALAPEKPLTDFMLQLKAIATNNSSFRVTVGEYDLFGPKKDIRVMRLQSSPALTRLHGKLLALADDFSATYVTPQYVDSGYTPHITLQTGHELKKDQSFNITTLSLVDMYPNGDIARHAVLQTYSLLHDTVK